MQFRAHRYVCEYPTTLTGSHGDFDVVIQDVNHGGARILGVRGFVTDDFCTVAIGESVVRARIVWATGRAIGVVFERQLTMHEFERVSRAQPQRRELPYRRDFGVTHQRPSSHA